MGYLIAKQFLFLMAIFLLLFWPGFSLLSFWQRKNPFLTLTEKLIASVGLSAAISTFLMIIIGRAGIRLNSLTITITVGVFGLFFFFFARWGKTAKKNKSSEKKESENIGNINGIFLAVFLLLVIIKTIYLLPNLVPSATDLGHHLYWVKKISSFGELPNYEKQEIILNENGKNIISQPRPISDFIIGEHLILSGIQMISGREFTSAFSLLTLFIIHLFSLLSLYALTRRIFENFSSAQNVAIWTLFFAGALYSISQSQMKYVSGGVVGNLFGNLLLPTIFLFLVIAIRKARADVLALAIFISFALIYFHHLSALILLLILLCFGAMMLFFNPRLFSRQIIPLLLDQKTWLTLGGAIIFFLWIYTPSYIKNAAVKTIMGTPEAEEHLGFSFWQLVYSLGEPRATLAIFGLLILIFFQKPRLTDTAALLTGWLLPLVFLILYPEAVKISMPSGRIANYLTFPIAILSAFALVWISEKIKQNTFFPVWLYHGILILALGAIIYNGFTDNNSYLKNFSAASIVRAQELFHSAEFLREKIPASLVIIHDHINIPGDAWIKVFLARDYNYPFYRAHFFRYKRATDKQEKCTLNLISAPNSQEARQCASDLNAHVFLVNETIDGQQFQHFNNYWKIYADPFNSVYFQAANYN